MLYIFVSNFPWINLSSIILRTFQLSCWKLVMPSVYHHFACNIQLQVQNNLRQILFYYRFLLLINQICHVS